MIKNCKKNSWMISTIVVAIIAIILIIIIASGKTVTDNVSSKKDLTDIGTFIDCLADKGVRIYGANWCGYTKKFVVETIGGFDVAEPIYIECTENAAECSAEGVSGYPTTKINGVPYNGERTFEGLAQATGCQAPNVIEQIQSQAQVANTNTAGGCGA